MKVLPIITTLGIVVGDPSVAPIAAHYRSLDFGWRRRTDKRSVGRPPSRGAAGNQRRRTVYFGTLRKASRRQSVEVMSSGGPITKYIFVRLYSKRKKVVSLLIRSFPFNQWYKHNGRTACKLYPPIPTIRFSSIHRIDFLYSTDS
ncbi:jg1553 [Pararge aegeria aegeria]|uniref:Jg1553 protein n=1 Tax=Pararge aegeria aegeria TaxID=348720 RepID=A0A8S4QIB1_9NEOP|nr:jg1553 [Pararge aegeria aegeria]